MVAWISIGSFIAGIVLAWLIIGRSKGIPREQYENLLKEKTESSNAVLGLTGDVSRLEAEKQGLLEKLQTEKAEMERLQQKFEDRFKNLAQEILEAQQKKFKESGEAGIKAIVDPLWEQLKDLQEYAIEAKALNQDMTKETKSLVDLPPEN